MRKFISTLIMIACLGVSMQSYGQSCNDVPVINSFEPNTGFIGSIVEIFGANFDATNLENNQVYFGATEAVVISASFGKLEVIVPVGASTAPISVKNQCDLTAYSKVAFNGIFCPTPIDNQTYQNTAFELNGIFGAYNMISQDMDLDGRPDVVSSGLNGGITIAKNNSTPGNLSFSAYNFSTATRSVFAADFDGDGLKDLVTNASVLRNTSTGPGNFGLAVAHSSQGISGYQVAAGDFNNDGKVDIVGENGNIAWIAFNTSTGPGHFSFGPRQVIGNVGSRCTGIQVADVDGDGRTDFIASQGGANRAVSVRNTITPGSMTASFEAPEFWSSDSDWSDGRGTFPYRAQIADFDKDGKIDFTSCNYLGNTNVAIWRNISTVGDIVFAPTVNIPSPTRNYRIGVGDVDGDGFPDVVTKSLGVNVFSVYKNTSGGPGAPTFASRVDYTSSSRAEVSGIVIGDLDGDFVPDIATSGISSRTIRFHRNTSAQVDSDPPTALTKNITVALNPSGTVSIIPADVDNGSSDACGLDRLELDITSFTCNDIGENEVILTVFDNAGNQTSAPAIVNVQPAAIIVTGQTTVCQGETISMTANDGDSYQWQKDGVDIPGATDQIYVATESGAYTVTVQNAGGCSGTSLPTDLTVNDNPTVDVFPTGTTYICPPSGTAVLTASQSSIYQWMKDGVDIPNATQQIYTATEVGNYSVRVIDLFGCSAESDEVIVAANPPEIDVVEGATAITSGSLSDYGDVFPNADNVKTFTINNTGSNVLDISQISVNGTDAQYFNVVGAPSSVGAGSSADFDLVFNAPNITSYSASVTIVSNDCDEGNITFDIAAEITCVAAEFSEVPADISVNTEEESCAATVNYQVGANGNPIPDISYSFTGATSGSGDGTGAGASFNLGITNVTLTVTNACGNDTHTFTVTVIDNEDPVLSDVPSDITVNSQDTDCSEIVNWTAPGASDNCSVSLTSSHNPGDVFPVGTTTVTYTATDGSGNAVSASFNVTVVPIPMEITMIPAVFNSVQSFNVSCNGATDGSIDATVTGGCTPYTYSWSNGDNVEDPTGLGAGTYTLTVTDANGSSINQTVTLTEPEPLQASINMSPENPVPTYGADHTIYLGYGTQTALLIASADGGNNTYSYSWTGADILNGGSSESIEVGPQSTSTYVVVVSDENGCSTTESFTVNVVDIRCLHRDRIKGKGKGSKGNYADPETMDKWDGKKVHICHKGRTLCISVNAVADHLMEHGDALGTCGTNVMAMASNNQESGFAEIIEVGSETETSDLNEFKLKINTYPNPASDFIKINFSSALEGDVKLVLLDVNGIVKATPFEGRLEANQEKEVELNTKPFKTGVYVIRLMTPMGIKSTKLLIKQ
ncbi:FG-GAP-like repeat-containing protein [Roseivirga sp. E12]|uniref:FG-GAP-like repeat-containing protein n=1 Tax=Roseivirga sp. E12 TaxID=2819237 RepID=UPI001ABD3D60|nr:FG-GAP-like repeat-containing protein [Roseivirga sp. E12]MBO3696889.1 VCBS repeat-containing protein [Roseivirga sp. E12]